MPRPALTGRAGSLPAGRQEGAHSKREVPYREATPFRAWSFTCEMPVEVKLPAHRAGLPGNEEYNYKVGFPPRPCSRKAGHPADLPVNSGFFFNKIKILPTRDSKGFLAGTMASDDFDVR